jgi:single-stranded DNA-binding protein
MIEQTSTNVAIIEGNLGKNPEFQEVGGRKFAVLRVATKQVWKDRGANKECVYWHNVHVFNVKQVDAIEKSARQGSRIRIEGRIKTLLHRGEDGLEMVRNQVISLDHGKGRLRILDAHIKDPWKSDTQIAIIEGALGRDPEVVNDGFKKYAKLLVATQEMWRERGELCSHTDWHDVRVHNVKLVDAIEKSVRCGSQIRIEGQVSPGDTFNGEPNYAFITLGRKYGRLRILDAPIKKADGRKDEAR